MPLQQGPCTATDGWAMLARQESRQESTATRAIVDIKSAVAGAWPGHRGAARSSSGIGAWSNAAAIARRSKPAAPPRAVDDVRADAVAVPPLVLRAARIFRGHPVIGYVMAVASVGLATALQWAAGDVYRSTPFLMVYPAVVLTAFVGGYRAGLLSALLAGLSQWLLFIPEFNLVAVVSYAVDAVLCVSLIEYINRSLEKETQAKEHQALLKDELHHRMHNLFAVIQSVIRFSLPNSNTPVFPSVIEDRLLARLQAIFDANRYIGGAAGSVALLDLIRGQIRGLESGVIVRGRCNLLFDAKMTQNFSLIMHELVTNSLKYGALSAPGGRVHIDLKQTCGGVDFDWTEVGGPPVRAPAGNCGGGFGSHILGRFARGFCSDVKISYEPSGFRYGVRIPRSQPA